MLSTNRQTRAVCYYDEALDLTDTERHEYADKRGDIDALRVIPGMRPTVFTVRPICVSAMLAIGEISHNTLTRAKQAFMIGVERVENLLRADTGERVPLLLPTGTAVLGGKEIKVWRDEELEAIGTWAIIEIGGVAYAHSDFPPGIARLYPLLRSSLLVSDRVAALHAEKNLRDAQKSNDKPSKDATAPAPERSQLAPNGDAPIAATATA